MWRGYRKGEALGGPKSLCRVKRAKGRHLNYSRVLLLYPSSTGSSYCKEKYASFYIPYTHIISCCCLRYLKDWIFQVSLETHQSYFVYQWAHKLLKFPNTLVSQLRKQRHWRTTWSAESLWWSKLQERLECWSSNPQVSVLDFQSPQFFPHVLVRKSGAIFLHWTQLAPKYLWLHTRTICFRSVSWALSHQIKHSGIQLAGFIFRGWKRERLGNKRTWDQV